MSSVAKRLDAEQAQLFRHPQPLIEPPPRFNASKHLCYEAPSKRYTLTEFGVEPASKDALSDFSFCEPFSLLTPEGVQAMLHEIMQEDMVKKCGFQLWDDDGKPYQHWDIRTAAKHSKFVKEIWSSPEVTKAVSDAAQFPLEPTMECELGHVNLQLKQPYSDGVEGWHHDSNCPFVCIVMLSDPTDMVGGETAFRRKDGSEHRIRYPKAGWATVMQGMAVEHAGTLVSAGNMERVVMVTSYQAQDHMLPNWNNGRIYRVRNYTDHSELYPQWAASRLRVMAERAQRLADKLDEDRAAGRYDYSAMTEACMDLQKFHQTTLDEMVDESECNMG